MDDSFADVAKKEKPAVSPESLAVAGTAVALRQCRLYKEMIRELLDTPPNFRRAYEEDGLEVNAYADFGPVMLFRTQLLNGFSRLIDEIRIIPMLV